MEKIPEYLNVESDFGIIIDLWGTLFNDSRYCKDLLKSRVDILSKIAIKYKIPPPQDGWAHTLKEERSLFRRNEISGSVPCIRSRVGRLLFPKNNNKIDCALDEVLFHFKKLSRIFKPSINRNLLGYIRKVREIKIPLILLSNTGFIDNADTRILLYENRVSSLFNSILLSSELGISKPNPEIFLYACYLMNRKPNKTLLIGNDPHLDIMAGGAAGLLTLNVDAFWENGKK